MRKIGREGRRRERGRERRKRDRERERGETKTTTKREVYKYVQCTIQIVTCLCVHVQ